IRRQDAGATKSAVVPIQAGLHKQHALFEGGGHGAAEVRGSFDGADAGGGHGGVFVLCGALAAADDGAGMAHAAAWWRGLPRDEPDDWLFHAGLDEFGGAFFGIAADFADHDDGARVGIVVEKFDGVEKRSADDGVAADADASGLTDAEAGELID